MRNILRFILQSSFIPHPVKYIPWAFIKFFKLKAPPVFELSLPDNKTLSLKGTDVHFQLWYWWGIRAHEYDTVKLVLGMSPDIRSFWDVGAYFGQYALYLSKMNPDMKVLGFEPTPETRQKFQNQVQMNSLNIEILPYAISDKAGQLEFYNQKDNSSNSSLSPKRKRGAEVIQVDVKSLDEVAIEKNIQNLDLVKIDVEHNELNVLKGMKTIINKFRPMIVMEVLPAFPSSEADEILVPENYSFFFVTYDGLIQMKTIKRPLKEIPWRWKQRTPYYNFIFCPNEKMNELRKASRVITI